MNAAGARLPEHEVPSDTQLVIVDGDNLLHRVRGTRDEGGLRWLLPRLRGWLPPGLHVVVMLDGHAEPGAPLRSRVSPRIEFHHSGALDGDGAIVRLVSSLPYGERIRALVVTDDRALSDRVRRAGSATRRLDWLVHQLARAMAEAPPKPTDSRPVGLGAGRVPRTAPPQAHPGGEEARPVWKPGRGATRKRGNPHRGSTPG